MTEEQIFEGNKLIAEFMTKNVPLIVGESTIKQTRYHASWDWLMPVVEKICETVIHINPDETKVTACFRTFGMISDDGEFMVRFEGQILFKDDSLLKATYKAVIDFIQIQNDINCEK